MGIPFKLRYRRSWKSLSDTVWLDRPTLHVPLV